jgi:lipopolysaccharide export system permease protein
MRILSRYLLRSYLVPVAYCLLGFSMIFMVFDLFGDLNKLMDAKVSISHIILYYLCLLSPTLEYITPASLMLAALYTLWQLSKNSELTAMRAGGVSLQRVMLPFVAVGFAFSVVNCGIKEFVVPPATQWSKKFKDTIVKRDRDTVQHNLAYFNPRDRRIWMIGRMDTERPTLLTGVEITDERTNGTRKCVWSSGTVRYLDEQWWMFDPMVQNFDDRDNPIGQPVPAVPGRDTVVEMTAFSEKPIDFVNEVRSWELLTSFEMWQYLHRHPGLSKDTRAQKMTAFHNRLSMPWACLVVTLFAVPAGVRTGRQSALVGVFRGVAIFFAFYAVMQLGLYLGMRRIVVPWLGAWLPNLAFLTTGFVATIKMR